MTNITVSTPNGHTVLLIVEFGSSAHGNLPCSFPSFGDGRSSPLREGSMSSDQIRNYPSVYPNLMHAGPVVTVSQ
jgi:hypothetical protein